MNTLPEPLIEQVREGRVILFLGAGALKGAVHPKGFGVPDAKQLASALCDRYLSGDLKDRPLSQVAELAISERSLAEVQDFIASLLQDFAPSDFHRLLPTFVWKAMATTNYDLVVEKAYDCVSDRAQDLSVFRKDGERIEDKLRSTRNLIYLKLHGCITDTADRDVPLILTPDQYITHRKGRSRLFDRFKMYACEYPIVFVGHSLGDSDIRAILMEIDELSEARPRSFIVAPGISEPEERMWSAKRFTCVKLRFQDFLEKLDTAISPTFRSLAVVLSQPHDHPITKRFKVANAKPSESLSTLLSRDTEYIDNSYKYTHLDPKAFYKGYFVDFSPIIQDLDVKRSIADDILLEAILASEEERSQRTQLYAIKGHAGSGKTVLLKRIAWEAATKYGRLCLWLRNPSNIDYEALREASRLCDERIFLFIDPVSDFSEVIEQLYFKASKDKIQLTILGAERHNEWNTQCDHLDRLLTEDYEIKYLVEQEIESLIKLLTVHDSLGHLKGLSLEMQKNALSKKAGRQLLVALHEATQGKPFTDIIFDEYKSILSPQAQLLYLSVCVLGRLGIHTRAGLISRVHGIPFTEFRDRLFKPLEFIVFAMRDDLTRDYIYRARHSHIADIVFERVLNDAQERFDEYVRLINVLDVDYGSDREALTKLLNAKHLMSLFRDPQMIRQLYKAGRERNKDNPMLMQQEAIFEMTAPGGSLDTAGSLLKAAHDLAKSNYTRAVVAHSISVLALKKAKRAQEPLEKQKFQREARRIANDLSAKLPISPHSFTTLIQIDLDELSAFMEQGNESLIEKKIKETEKSIARAVQNFSDDTFILDAEARFAEMVNKSPMALEALKKAFNSNKRSPYIALRLAKTYEREGQSGKAITTLTECLEANPNDKTVNFNLGMLLMRHKKESQAEVKHYLRRAFTEGDTNYAAQFYYARCLYLEGNRPDAMQIFAKLSDAPVDIKMKKGGWAPIVDEKDIPIRYSGLVQQVESSYAFVLRDGPQDRLFAHLRTSEPLFWDSLKEQQRVTFEIAFNYRGAVAVNLRQNG